MLLFCLAEAHCLNRQARFTAFRSLNKIWCIELLRFCSLLRNCETALCHMKSLAYLYRILFVDSGRCTVMFNSLGELWVPFFVIFICLLKWSGILASFVATFQGLLVSAKSGELPGSFLFLIPPCCLSVIELICQGLIYALEYIREKWSIARLKRERGSTQCCFWEVFDITFWHSLGFSFNCR